MKICIDPGHGMANRTPGTYDPGATHTEGATRYEEADIALHYALGLKDVLRARNYPVFLTRDDRTDLAPLRGRTKQAEDQGCAIFLSIHMNDVESDDANGTETLYRGAASLDLARRLQGALVGVLGLRDRGVKERSELAVLRFDGPAALLELGFIANDRDRNRILQPSVRAQVCEAIADELDRIRKVASAQIAQLDAEDDPDAREADDDITEATYYDTNAAAFALAAPQTRAGFVTAFTDLGARSNFNHEAFADLVASWNLSHFTANELLYLGASHYGAGACHGLNSLPPQSLWANMEKTARLADAIRAEFGRPIRVLSAFRDTDYNTCVGGAPASQHRRFNALDLANVGGTTAHMFQIAKDLMQQPVFAGGLKHYGARGFIHIDTRGELVLF